MTTDIKVEGQATTVQVDRILDANESASLRIRELEARLEKTNERKLELEHKEKMLRLKQDSDRKEELKLGQVQREKRLLREAELAHERAIAKGELQKIAPATPTLDAMERLSPLLLGLAAIVSGTVFLLSNTATKLFSKGK